VHVPQPSNSAENHRKLVADVAQAVPTPPNLEDIRNVLQSELRGEKRAHDADADERSSPSKRPKTSFEQFMRGQEFLKGAMLDTMAMSAKVATASAEPRAFLDHAAASATSASTTTRARLEKLEGFKLFLDPGAYQEKRQKIIDEGLGEI
jgi:hypothetical protein